MSFRTVCSTSPGSYAHVVLPRETKRRQACNYAVRVMRSPAPPSPGAESNPDGRAFVRWLFEQSKLSVDDYRWECLQRRLPSCLRILRVPSVAHAQRLLEQSPALLPEALNSMLLGVSGFFRDQAVFDTLRRQILPRMVQTNRLLYIWSAGCSDGAELYSIAFLLDQLGALDRCTLVGTDCRSTAIRRARSGVCDPVNFDTLPLPLRDRYAHCSNGVWRVNDAIRARLHWNEGNLLAHQEIGRWDLILCRNTAMYFEPSRSMALWSQLEATLRPGGILVVGRAERPMNAQQLVALGPCIYRRIRR